MWQWIFGTLLSGTGLSYSGTGVLPNNTFITADSNGMIGTIDCSSGSTTPNTGRWLAPSGSDLTSSTTDPYEVTVGGVEDPGSLVVTQRVGHVVSRSFEGVYTCVLEDEAGEQVYWRVGIYRSGFNSKNYCTMCRSHSYICSLILLSYLAQWMQNFQGCRRQNFDEASESLD